MKLTITTLIAALVASMAWVATAQDLEKNAPEKKATEKKEEPRRGGPGGRGRNPMANLPLYKALDKDGDGALSEEEIKNASAALLALDKDKDGKLSKEEITPAWGGRGGDRQRRGGGGEGGRPERPKRPSAE